MNHLSISEQIFEHVKALPGFTPNQYAERLKFKFNYNTVRTLINQMVRADICRRDPDGRVQAVADSYRPLPSNNKLRTADKRKVKAVLKTLASAPTPTILQQAKASPAITVSRSGGLTADYVMENISIAEGKKLFTLLSNVF